MLSTNGKDAASELAMLCMLAALIGWVILVWIMGRIGRPLSSRALVDGAVLIATCGIVAAILGPVYVAARPKARVITCLSNLKQIQPGVIMYAQDWDDALPPASQWATLSSTYTKYDSSSSVWHCPEAKSPYSYAYNQALSGVKITDLDEPNLTVDLFEADAATWNAVGGVTDLVGNRHNGSNCGFLDGHAAFHLADYYNAGVQHWQPLPLKPKKKL